MYNDVSRFELAIMNLPVLELLLWSHGVSKHGMVGPQYVGVFRVQLNNFTSTNNTFYTIGLYILCSHMI